MAAPPFPRQLRLPRSFFCRPTLTVAEALVGCVLVRRLGQTVCAVRLVEVEAYLGQGEDPASHAHRGPTARNRTMFATPGCLYVYFIYGMHHCMNVVCEAPGMAGAVLLRAAEPLQGVTAMERRRGLAGRALTNGPGKLCAALGVDRRHDGTDLVCGPIGLWPGPPPRALGRSRRIGIRVAVQRRWRFFDRDSPWVSPAPRGRAL